ncbi:alpha/beta hydrolase [Pseudoflavitalea sp. G-6-1-2]|uniref:alpha/beta fold hydrolase n=1 Tax=Pseudoflavitalea sp. G-6-1-2 TaxID=2728841 RepID=UPI00146D9A54|nr:alpha/beta hydrolase [Pseudoflavitalea sp. G-6-1-2]NML22316.1 alpha/beta hydrolase [Pseudoflavitalea sp. G-6-1-2]
MNAQTSPGRYANVNGLKLYYEVHGKGTPLVLLHGGGSTIESTYGRILPLLAKHHQVIAIELQAHGHTADIDRPLSFEQDADDVAELLKQLHIARADIMGFSNGATTAMQVAIRNPQLVNKLVLVAALTKRAAMPAGFFDGFEHATLNHMPKPLQDAFLKANNDPKALLASFNRDVSRMKAFSDIPDETVRKIQAPALFMAGDKDGIPAAHALELSQLLPNGQLVILPGIHGELLGEICAYQKGSTQPAITAQLVETFLQQQPK